MPIVTSSLDLMFPDIFFDLGDFLPNFRAILKLEGFNITGSIKIKSALFMVDDLERRGLAIPGRTTIVESSSGNLGVALSLICRLRNYGFICVSDPNIASANVQAIRAYGGRVLIVDERDANGGYLENRIKKIQHLIAEAPDRIWLNQYANPANKQAHARLTAREILQSIPKVDYLFVGTGTTGTAMGIAEAFSDLSPTTEIIAVEPEGSVTFGAAAARRLIPGIGTSRPPELADRLRLHRVVQVSEASSIRACHQLVRRHGLLLGGSSGSVVAAMQAQQETLRPDSVVVGLSPDSGEHYLDTIYDPDWVRRHFPGEADLCTSGLSDAPPGGLCGPLRTWTDRTTEQEP